MGRFATFFVVLSPWFQRGLPGEIDKRIAQEIGRARLRLFQMYTKELPHYRFVDLYRATEHYCEQRGESVKIESEHEESPNSMGWCTAACDHAPAGGRLKSQDKEFT